MRNEEDPLAAVHQHSEGSQEAGATAQHASDMDTSALPPAEANPSHARRLAFVSVGLIIVIALIVVFLLWPRVETNDAQVDAHIPTISPRVAGYVTAVQVNDNQAVKAGDLLVELDAHDYQASVDQARAAYMVAVAEAQEAKANVRLTRDTTNIDTSVSLASRQGSEADLSRTNTQYLQSTSASLEEARANLVAKETINDRAQSDLKRYKILLSSQDVSQLQFDSIAATARVAQADVTTAEKQLLGAEQSTEVAKAQAANAQAQLKRAQANVLGSVAQKEQVPVREAAYESANAAANRAKATLDEALLQLSYTRIAAPIGGQVTQRGIEVGQYVVPGQQLMTIVPLQDVYITANFKETQLAHVRAGQRVKIHADEYSGVTLWGSVESIAGATGSKQALLPPQNATGNFVKVVQRIPVKILVDPQKEGDSPLRPGMNVEVSIYVR